MSNLHESSQAKNSVVLLMFALLVAIFAFQLNASMLSPALATMAHELQVADSEIGLTQTAFFAAAALFSLFLPRWADLIGRKKLLFGMLAVTGIGCVISALAPTVHILGLGRVIQGVAGPVVPMCLIMLHAEVKDPKRYAKLMAVLTSVNGGIAGVDALAGGFLAGNFGFRSVFWTMAIVCALGALCILFFTKESRASEQVPMDWKGVVPLVIVLACLYFAFNEAGKLADASWILIAVLVIIACISFVIFWKTEQKVKHPLVTTTYMKQRRTWGLLLTTLLTMTGVFAVMNGLVPNLAQDPSVGPGLSADVVSWFTLTPYAIAGLIMGPISGQLAAKFGFKPVLQGGLILSIIGLAILAFLAPKISSMSLLGMSIFIGITYAGVCNIMLNGLGIVLSPADNQGYLPGMNAGAFNLGAGLSFAILFAVLSAVGASGNLSSAYQASIIAGAVLIALALVTSFLIPKPEDLED